MSVAKTEQTHQLSKHSCYRQPHLKQLNYKKLNFKVRKKRSTYKPLYISAKSHLHLLANWVAAALKVRDMFFKFIPHTAQHIVNFLTSLLLLCPLYATSFFCQEEEDQLLHRVTGICRLACCTGCDAVCCDWADNRRVALRRDFLPCPDVSGCSVNYSIHPAPLLHCTGQVCVCAGLQ